MTFPSISDPSTSPIDDWTDTANSGLHGAVRCYLVREWRCGLKAQVYKLGREKDNALPWRVYLYHLEPDKARRMMEMQLSIFKHATFDAVMASLNDRDRIATILLHL